MSRTRVSVQNNQGSRGPRMVYFVETTRKLIYGISSKKAAKRIAEEEGGVVAKMPLVSWNETTWDLPTLRMMLTTLEGEYLV